MTMCFRAFDGKVAIWEKPASGDPLAPFDDPVANIDLVRFHSDLQYLSNAIIQLGLTINHALVAGQTGTGYTGSAAGSASTANTPSLGDGQVVTTDYDLYTHGLGYVPLFFVVYNGNIVAGSTLVQSATKQSRLVSAFATTSKIRLRDIGFSSTADLAAVTRSYDLYIFRNPAADMAQPLFHAKLTDPTPEAPRAKQIVLGHGKISSNQRPMRRVNPGDSQLAFPFSKTTDVRNGAFRTLRADGSLSDIGKYTGGVIGMNYLPISY